MQIPKLIHFCWGGSPLPQWAEYIIAKWQALNPEYETMIHGGEIVLPELRSTFDAITDWSSKSDMVRYSALRKYGGWYADVDILPLRPLSEAVSAWSLDGSRMLVSKQQGHNAGARLPYAACPIAAQQDAPGLRHIIERAAKVKTKSRTAYGPELIKKCVEDRPEFYEAAEPGWFFPVAIHETERVAPVLFSGRPPYLASRATSGQQPFGVHLWASAVDLNSAWEARHEIETRPIALVQQGKSDGHPLGALAEGLRKIGYNAVITANPKDHIGPIRPALMCMWNGRREGWPTLAERHSIPRLVLEHGFFDRRRWAQVDGKNILDKATWAQRITEPPPSRGKDVIERLGLAPKPVRARRRGYVLVLGQVNGDSQLEDSPIAGTAPLLRYMGRRMPNGIPAIFRPHPLDKTPDKDHRRSWPSVVIHRCDPSQYAKDLQSTTLQDDLDGARFCVAINSNALVEATLAGVPCMAFGPSLGLMAGAYYQCSVDTLTSDLSAMLSGWEPDPEAVDRYLLWLAANQWNSQDFLDAATLRGLLRMHGITPPGVES
jgi:hypothetical protein